MKITYVIAPFKSTRYLIRCINAILRQTAENNRIIVAENSFEKDEELEEFLGSAKSVMLISDEPETEIDKIKEALSLADEDSLINILSVDSVAVPIASETVSEFDADIIAVSYAIERKGIYDVKPMNENPYIDSGLADIQNLFFKKAILSDLTAERLCERMPFELWIDKLILDGASQAASGEICLYCDAQRIKHNMSDAELCLENKGVILEMAEKSLNANSKVGLFLFDKYLARLYKCLISNQNELSVKSELFDIVKKLGEIAKADRLASRLFALYLGMDIDSLADMNTDAYLFYADRMLTFADKPLTKARLEQMVADAIAPIEKKYNNIQIKQFQKIKKLESQVKSFKSNLKSPRKLIKGSFTLLKRWLRIGKN